MKIVITGATGQVGNRLGQKLCALGFELRAIVRDKVRARISLSYPAQLFDLSELDQALRGADALVHLAGENIAAERWTDKRKDDLRASRIDTAEALRAAVVRGGAHLKCVVSASAVGIYGSRGDEVLTEASAPGSDFLAKLCQDWEYASSSIPAEKHVMLRFGVVLAKSGGFLRKVVPMFRTLGASRLGDGRQYMSWIHLDDLTEVLARAITDPQTSGVYNACAPHPVTNAELTAKLRAHLHASAAPPAPIVALKVLYGQMSEALLGSQRAEPERLVREGFKFKHPDLDSALTAIYPKLLEGEMQSYFESYVDRSPAEVWDFFSRETNLEQITPPTLNFKVLGKSTPELGTGTLIDYRLKIHGVPASWQTLIGQWEPPRRFSDEQLKGPYAKWHHVHDFTPLGQGVHMTDTVRWRLPLGRLGRTAALPLVIKEVESIFKYRAEAIARIFSPR